MHSPLTTLLTTLLAPLAVQAVAFTNSNYDGITAGIPFTLTWSGNGTPADLVLATRPSNDLSKVMTIIASATGGSYTWTPPLGLAPGSYAVTITQSDQTNYTPLFPIASTARYAASSLPSSPPPSIPPPSTPPPPSSSTTALTPPYPFLTSLESAMNGSNATGNGTAGYTGGYSTGGNATGGYTGPLFNSTGGGYGYGYNGSMFMGGAGRVGVGIVGGLGIAGWVGWVLVA